MSDAVIFLDIDGVLNDTPCCPKGPRIMPRQAEHLAALVRASGASIVLTSSWRKWVAPESMTLLGFERLLWTHGIAVKVRGIVRDHKPSDIVARAAAIDFFLGAFKLRHVVLDDRALPIGNLVQTNGTVGLTCEDVVRAYKILRDQ